MKTVTQEQFLDLLCQRKGATFLTAKTRTEAKLRKTDNPFGRVWKHATTKLCVNFHYDAGVLRRLEKEGKTREAFQRGESWHVAIVWDDGSLTPFSRHKITGDLYLRAMRLGMVGEIEYRNEEGFKLVKEEVEEFLPKREVYKNQGLDEPLEFLTYKLDSILEVTIDGESYAIVKEAKETSNAGSIFLELQEVPL